MIRSLAGVRVLLIEDEMMVAMLIEEALQELGCKVVGPISRLENAALTLDAERFDCALLDINLRGEVVYPVAEQLTRLGVPFGFVTGYGTADLDASFANRPVLHKPFAVDELVAVLARLTQGHKLRPNARHGH